VPPLKDVTEARASPPALDQNDASLASSTTAAAAQANSNNIPTTGSAAFIL
jgi:hypothetical protein